jgi:outer membrane murein-binding lipoprotein Lpp
MTAQDQAAQADTWGEQLQARMGKLTDDIHTLNARLDRLEERNKTKV